ncbi:muscle M-line assembly protein unc-89-like [Melanotaenia boesemani]|uniref:muscle M-line assembly protein unc-89-like n=1 Tax=Melanotaenia boesemani TaxID=1250792 RepID=UPI001C0576BE|nr:muscle M-line assembly protein unc-89-like [Melanotaenia boesemani]
MKEEIGTTRKSNEQREQKVSEGLKKDDKAEDSIRSREAGVTRSSEPGAAKKWKVREESMKTVESERVNEGGARAAGSRPVFVKKTSSLVVKTGEMSEFTCQFQGDPPPTVGWLKDGHPLDNNPDYDIMIKENKSKLTVFYPTTDHEGTYDLVITNKHGKSTCSAILQISDKKPQRKTAVAQEVVITEGVEKGEEHHESLIEEELQTYMDLGKATLQVPQAVIHRHQSLDESNTPSPVEIRITAATPVPEMCEESGEDRPQVADVQSDDGASQTVKHKFTFSFDVVGEAPLVVMQLENISCSESSVAVLQCVISGEPPPEVTWYHDDICLDVTADKHRAEVDVKVYRLFISGFTSSDAGVYKCVARNKLGEVSSISEVSFQAGEPVQFSEVGEVKERDGLTRSGRLRKSSVGLTEDVKEPSMVQKAAEDKPQIRQTPSDVKPPRSRPGLFTVTPTISGCGLQGSAAVIKVSQIKQAFESDSSVALPPPSPEEQRKDTKFPEEFIPVVDTSPDQQVWMAAPGPDSMHRDQDDGLPMLPVAPEPIPSETSQPVEAVEGAAERHYVVKEFVEEVPEFSELLRPQPQKAAALPEQMEAGKVEMVKEEVLRMFDRTSSFIPFKPEKGPAVKHSVKSSGPTKEKPERDRTAEDVQEDISAGLHGSGFVEGLTETGTLLDQEVKGLEEVEQVSEEAELDGKELISIPEQSMDSGIFVSMPDSKVDVMKVSSEMVPADVTETKIKTEGDRISISAESEPLVVKPKVEISIKPPDLPAEAAISVDGTSAAEAGGVARASLEEEEVTFGAVYDYYNPPTDWGRPLSPESEMSIEIGSTMSEEITEVAERFYTPGSSTEVSQPIAESLHTIKSPTSFCTPSSEISPGFTTPDEYPFSPVKHQRPSTADSSEMFFSPVHFLPSPAERGFETSGVNMDENRFASQNRGSLGLGTLQEKVQGIPPAFLKPLIKKRVFENDSLTFYAEVFGLPSPEVRWFCNKTQLVADDKVTMERDGDSISLMIRNITKADQGEYICEAVNYVGEARSVALVGVVSQEVRFMPAPPAVTHQHVMEFDVEENDSSRSPSPQEILLEVELDENEVKEFEKQVKIITIPEYTADNKSMVISLDVLPSIYEEGAVDFVTQEHDDLKIAFEVTEMPPRFINPICDMETPEGTTVMFECSLMGIPSPVVSWFKGDKKIPHSNKKYLHFSDGDNHFLKIYKVTTQDSGVYTCRAINLVGETLCRASLVVLNAKAFSGKTRGRELTAVSLGGAKVQPQKFDLMVGNTSFDGEQVSEIELEFEFEQEADESQRAVRLVANTNSETSEQGEKYVSVNFDVFAEPAKDDKVEFKGKSTDMCSFQFQVTETPPKCIIPLTNVTAAVGTPVILQCLVGGKPNPIAQWFKDGEPVKDSRCIIQEKTAGHFNLLITNVTQSDAGEYKCMIQNSAGFTETTALLKVF